MDTCFVIQPFDKDKFDKRFTDIFEPAIKAAGLEPYRVDRDPSVRIPIEQIEEGIKSAKICFAEITLDNPNVWYELGFAFALDKDVVMVTEKKDKFPFDIQHRQVINYKTDSTSDFDVLKKSITDKLNALLKKRGKIQTIIDSPVIESEGLKQHEVTMMIMMLENQITEDNTVSASRLQKDMETIGFTKAASNLAFRELTKKKFIEQHKEYQDGDEYVTFKLTMFGEDWLIKNQEKIEMKLKLKKPKTNFSNVDDDLPF